MHIIILHCLPVSPNIMIYMFLWQCQPTSIPHIIIWAVIWMCGLWLSLQWESPRAMSWGIWEHATQCLRNGMQVRVASLWQQGFIEQVGKTTLPSFYRSGGRVGNGSKDGIERVEGEVGHGYLTSTWPEIAREKVRPQLPDLNKARCGCIYI
jgi:hypothetical protein